jgi:hypothetical protein
METRGWLFALILPLSLASIASPAHATWSQFAVVQALGTQYSQQAATDGAGGAVVAWYDARSGSGAIYAHHVLASDTVDPAWPVDGLFVGDVYGDPTIAIVSDGAGGAIMAWSKSTDYSIYAHHVLASGILDPAWPADGVPVCTAPDNQISVRAVSDGTGGAILTWNDARNSSTSDWDIYAHRVLSSGVVDPAWPANGVGVCTEAGDQTDPVVTSDGSGGIVVAWGDFRSDTDYDVYAQRLLSTGAVASAWPAGGKLLCGASDDQGAPCICSDGAGGAIVAWSDYRSGTSYDIYAMRVGATGALAQGWHNNGEVICNAAGNQERFDIIADGSGGAIGSWYDSRAGDGYTDIYVQRLTASGSPAWTTNGVAMCTAPSYQVSPSLGSDGSGGAYLAWQDRRHETTLYENELYLHHVLASGTPDPTWPANGGRVTFDGHVRFGGNYGQPILSKGSGNATVFWAGEVGSGFEDVYALNITSTWTPSYVLQVSIAPAGAGSVTKDPDRISYAANSTVTLTAVPASGRIFIAWSGDASGSANPLDVAMDVNKTIVAQFSNVVGVEETPLAFALEAIHPNPNPGPVRVTYTLPQAARVRLAIYDLTGREVGRLADGVVPAGQYVSVWDARVGGRPARSGIYFVSFQTPARSWVRRLVLTR